MSAANTSFPSLCFPMQMLRFTKTPVCLKDEQHASFMFDQVVNGEYNFISGHIK